MRIFTHLDSASGEWVRFTGTPQLDPYKINNLLDQGIWTQSDLTANGLKVATPFEVPEGKVIVPGTEYFINFGLKQMFEVEDAPPPVVVVPEVISPLQARKALRALGIKHIVDGWIETLTEEQQEEWEYATEVWRNNPIIALGAQELGMSEEDVDGIFILAATMT